jgi:hypothetical protein
VKETTGVTVFWWTVGRYSSSGRVTMTFTYLTDQTCLSVNTDKATMKPAVDWDYLHGAHWKDWSLRMYLVQQKLCARRCVQLLKGVPICSEIIHQCLEADEPLQISVKRTYKRVQAWCTQQAFLLQTTPNRMFVLQRQGYDQWK